MANPLIPVDDMATEAKRDEEAVPSTDQAVDLARDTVLDLVNMLLCHACGNRFIGDNEASNSKPWRSRNCEHLLCTVCATRKAIPNGSCPVQTCHIPTQPVDIVQDFVTGQIIDACMKLSKWAYQIKGSNEDEHIDEKTNDNEAKQDAPQAGVVSEPVISQRLFHDGNEDEDRQS